MFTPPPHRSVPRTYLDELAMLALKHDMTVQFWRQLSADGLRYRVCLSAGFHVSSPNVCWAHVFPIEHPLAKAVEHLAESAWGYYVETGYRFPGEEDGLTDQDIQASRVFKNKHPRVRAKGSIETIDAWVALGEDLNDTMCNEHRRRMTIDQIREEFSQIRIPLRFPEGAPNLPPLDSVKITDNNVIIRADDKGGAELVQRRWSWPGPTGKPVYNFRSEGRELTNGRCLIVADGFYEFTDPPPAEGAPKKRLKDKWLFTKAGEDWFCIAGIWRNTPEVGEAYTMLTVEPGPDVAPYHNRQIVILEREDWERWLDPGVQSKTLLKPLPAGSLKVERVR